jgi:protein-tyrosine phosphatase
VIDLHTHILPAIDDGLQTEDEAVEFARMAHADGVRTIVATPHHKEGVWDTRREDILERVARLRERLARERVDIVLEPGAEVHLCPDLVGRIRAGSIPTLADNGKTLLLELSLTQYPLDLENLVFQMKVAGIEPVFAHPERIRYFQDDVGRYEAVVRLGAWGQITTGSILGLFGSTAAEYSEELLRKGLVHVLASDGHSLQRRSPVLRPALEACIPFVGERFARSMVEDVPRALLAGAQPQVPPVEASVSRRRTFFSRLLRRG